MSKLPKSLEETSQLKNMKVGDSGYIVPWGMWVDMDGDCWLNEEYTTNKDPMGTAALKITRVEDGYIAFINDMDYDYKWTKQDGPSYASPTSSCYGKVVGFTLDINQGLEVVTGKTKSLWDLFWKSSNN